MVRSSQMRMLVVADGRRAMASSRRLPLVVAAASSPAPTTTSANASEPSGVSRLGVATTSTAVLALLYNKQQTWKHVKAPRATPFKLKKIKGEPLKKVKVEPEEMLSL